MSKLKVPGAVISVVSPRPSVSTRTDVSSLSTRYSYNTDTFDASNFQTKQSRSITDESLPSYLDTSVTETIKTESFKPDTDIDSSRLPSNLEVNSRSSSSYRRDGDTGSYEGSKRTIISCHHSETPSNTEFQDSIKNSYSDSFESYSGSRSGSLVTSPHVSHLWSPHRSYGSESFELSQEDIQKIQSGSLR